MNEPRAGRKAVVPAPRFDLEKNVDGILLSRSLPAVVVDQQMQVVEFRGNTTPYLEMAPGKASLHLGKVVREDLMLHLRAAIHQAGKENIPVRKNGIQLKSDGGFYGVNVEVIPTKGLASEEAYFVVLFQGATPPSSESAAPRGKRGKASPAALQQENARLSRHNVQLKQDLAQTRANLSSIIEEQEATNEEMRASNEEILSSNEELQSLNEELETAKEELQASNEELATLNEELRNRNLELNLADSDLSNVLPNVNVPLLVLSKEKRIRHFTPMAGEIFHLTGSEVGISIEHLKANFNVPDLVAWVTDSIAHRAARAQEAQDHEGHWYELRIKPYKMLDGDVNGTVLTWVDVEAFKRRLQKAEKTLDAAETSLQKSEVRYRLLFERNVAGIFFADADGRIIECNQAFAQTLGYASPREMIDLDKQRYLDASQWQRFIAQVRRQRAVTNFECHFRRKNGETAHVLMNSVLTHAEGGSEELIESIIMDVTGRMQAEASVRELSVRLLGAQDEERRKISRELHDTVGSSLTALILSLSALKKSAGVSKPAQKQLSDSLDTVKECAREVRTLSYLLHPPLLEEAGLASAIRWYLEGFAERSGIKVRVDIPPELKGSGRLPLDVETAFFRIVQESLTNVHLHSGSQTASVRVSRDGNAMTLEVRDTGRGIPTEVLGEDGKPGKPGVGISSMRERMKLLGGELTINSGIKGTAVLASLPAEKPS